MVIEAGYYEATLVSVFKGKTAKKNWSLRLDVRFDDKRFKGDWTFEVYLDPKGGWVASEGYIYSNNILNNGLYLLYKFVKELGTVKMNKKVYVAVANTDYLGMLNGSKIIMDWDVHLLNLSSEKGLLEGKDEIFSRIIDKTKKKT